MFNPLAVANHIIDKRLNEFSSVTNMELQKLIYFSHGFFLAKTNGIPLINELIEAWKFGPVVPTVYHEFKEYGVDPIIRKADTTLIADDLNYLEFVLSADAKSTIAEVLRLFNGFSGSQLSRLSHAENGPWDIVYKQSRGLKGADIPNNIITQYFLSHFFKPA